MKSIRIVLVTTMALLVASAGFAHIVYFEPQEKAAKPWQSPASDDYSFENPGVLDNLSDSKAIFGWLDNGNVDVYKITLDDETPLYDRYPVAMTLSPACNQTKNNYVNIAMVGKNFPPPTVDLPFALPEGMGVVVKINPRYYKGAERPVFYEPTANISWFLPKGMTEQCMMGNPPTVPPMATCDMSNIIAFTPPYALPLQNGIYYFVVWADDARHQDYTLSIGYSDEYYYRTDDEYLTYNNAYLHTPCTEPYPGK